MSSRRHDAGSAGKGPFTSGYTAHDVAALLGLSVGQIRAYIRAGFLARRRGPRGEHRLSLLDLVLLRTAKETQPRLVRNSRALRVDPIPY